MAHVFGRPTHRGDSLAYLGTQFVAERLKKETAQGVLCDSALRQGGWNLTLFDPQLAHGLSSRLLEVKEVKYTAAPPTVVELAMREWPKV